jgi:hypothetical protein
MIPLLLLIIYVAFFLFDLNGFIKAAKAKDVNKAARHLKGLAIVSTIVLLLVHVYLFWIGLIVVFLLPPSIFKKLVEKFIH